MFFSDLQTRLRTGVWLILVLPCILSYVLRLQKKNIFVTCLSTEFGKQKVKVQPAPTFRIIAFINKKTGFQIANFLKSDCVTFITCLYIVCRLAEPGVFAFSPAWPVGSRKSRMTNQQNAPSVEMTTQLVQGNKYSILNLRKSQMDNLQRISQIGHIRTIRCWG